ncbi:hypothetical protein GWI33_004604 [Rhynchophorus ferrugineus]|uniref:Uncharacterized protein n=1 Tax=Rhynchophorus ferrugineus TaxID=354439 RepID=A0A834IWY2_RHYFE|nr:hypothetical protein GWI33_004604 [Rhynchophorus ferrugineus]
MMTVESGSRYRPIILRNLKNKILISLNRWVDFNQQTALGVVRRAVMDGATGRTDVHEARTGHSSGEMLQVTARGVGDVLPRDPTRGRVDEATALMMDVSFSRRHVRPVIN